MQSETHKVEVCCPFVAKSLVSNSLINVTSKENFLPEFVVTDTASNFVQFPLKTVFYLQIPTWSSIIHQ